MSLSPTAASKPTAASRPRLRIARKRWLRRLLLALEVLALVVVLAVFTMAIALRHAMHTALPQIDGELHLAGLAAPVTITRDTQGVPSLNAASLDDLLFAQGFVTAQDRFFQMDALRRHAAGELAEILGPSLVVPVRRLFEEQDAKTLAGVRVALVALPSPRMTTGDRSL